VDRALLLLIGLRTRGAIRRMFRKVRGVRGAIALAVGIIVVGSWLLPSLLMLLRPGPPSGAIEAVQSAALAYGPVILLGVCALPLLTGQSLSLAFSPAEVDFLFAGPFTRRRLLAYKVLVNALGAAVLSLFIGLALSRLGGHALAPYLGGFLALILTQLFGMLIAVAGAAVGPKLFSNLRSLLMAVLISGIGIGVIAWLAPLPALFSEGWLPRLLALPPVQAALWPFAVFIRLLTAQSAGELAAWGLCALAINTLLFLGIVRLDVLATEAALSASERHAAQREQAQRSAAGAATAGWLGARWTFPWPAPPGGWLLGAGPIFWRQATTCLRGAPAVLASTAVMLVCILGFGLWTRLGSPLPPGTLAIVGIQVVVMLTIFQTVLLRFDFRADLDRMESLKALPLHPLAIAAGQLGTPVAFMTLSQWLLAAVGAGLFPSQGWIFLAAAAAVPGLNTMLVGVENFMFLLYPSRPPAGPVFDLQRMGRGTFISLAKMLVLLVAAALVAGAGAAAYFALGRSWPAAVLAGWIVLAVISWATVLAVAGAFRGFDVSRDVG
jgi:hypothetical protein